MIVAVVDGTTRVLGRSQGFNGLPVRDAIEECPVQGMVPTMTTAWQPTPAEIEALRRGAHVHVTICSADPRHPPIRLSVGEVP